MKLKRIFLTALATSMLVGITTTPAPVEATDFSGQEDKYMKLCSSSNLSSSNLQTCKEFNTYLKEKNQDLKEQVSNSKDQLSQTQASLDSISSEINSLNTQIEEKYEELKVEASNLDAKIKEVISNGNSTTIIASSNLFKYLEKYGVTVYSLDESNSDVNAIYNQAVNMINNGEIKYIFTIANEDSNSTVKKLIANTNVETQEWNTISNLTEAQRTNNEDYFTIMNSNLELLKNELYK